jgi:hypothetical protein
MKRIVSVLLVFLFLISCSPKLLQPWQPPELKFDKTPEYSVKEEIDKIPKPEPIVKIYAKQISDTSFKVVKSAEEADFVILAPSEYAKVGAVVKLAKSYKELVLDQEALVNTYITQINALKELVALEQKKSQMYRELWISSENAYRQEARDHKVDNFINRAGIYGVTVGSIIILLLAL